MKTKVASTHHAMLSTKVLVLTGLSDKRQSGRVPLMAQSFGPNRFPSNPVRAVSKLDMFDSVERQPKMNRAITGGL